MDSQRADAEGRLVCSVNTNKLDCRLLLSAVLQVFFFPQRPKIKKTKKKKKKRRWREDVTRSLVRTPSWGPSSFSWSYRPISGHRMLSYIARSAVFPVSR